MRLSDDRWACARARSRSTWPFPVPCSALFCAAVLVAIARPAAAHPVPFSYIDVRVDGRVIEVSVVAHAWDLIHDLNLGPETTDERFLESSTLQAQAAAIAAIFGVTTAG